MVDLVTGLPEVANADLALATMPDREPRLRVAIGPVRQDYAFVILDCPLSLPLLSVNALVAAQQGSGLDLTAYGTEAAIQDAAQKRLKG